MKLLSISDSPVFINKYIEQGDNLLAKYLSDFLRFITKREIWKFSSTGSTNFLLEYDLKDEDYNIRYFAEYYLNKVKLDNKYECQYEEDLDIPKEIANEVFKGVLEIVTVATIHDENVEFIIDSCEFNKLTLRTM